LPSAPNAQCVASDGTKFSVFGCRSTSDMNIDRFMLVNWPEFESGPWMRNVSGNPRMYVR
jgi:hypothetical protein